MDAFATRAWESARDAREALDAWAETSGREGASARAGASKGKKTKGSLAGASADASGGGVEDIDMSDLRAVTLEKALDSLMPSVQLPSETNQVKHRGQGAKHQKAATQEEEEKAKKAVEVSKELTTATKTAPLASMREVELEMKQLQQRAYKRALLRKEIDIQCVAWKPRELIEFERASPLFAPVGEKRARDENAVAAPPNGQDVMIWIELFHPVKQGYLVMDVIVRGSTPIVCFKDMIYCLRDVQAKREGHAPSKNGFLFIEGVFYNDMRSPDAVDYSEPLLDYQKKDGLTAPGAPVEMNMSGKGFTAQDMHGVKFADVPLHIGKSYVMTHQGKCEHKWRVRDVRLPHNEDDTAHDMFPLVLREGRVFRRGCGVCGVFDSAFVTYSDRMASESPAFFCKICYDTVHCDAQGNKVYNDYEQYTYDHE
jgi:snRNA-activating protein complex subunit 3